MSWHPASFYLSTEDLSKWLITYLQWLLSVMKAFLRKMILFSSHLDRHPHGSVIKYKISAPQREGRDIWASLSHLRGLAIFDRFAAVTSLLFSHSANRVVWLSCPVVH